MRKPMSTTSVHPNPREGEGLTVLFAGHSQTEPGHRMGPQVLNYYLVHTVLEGTGRFRCRDQTYDLRAGDSFFIFPGELHTYQADEDDPWRYRWIAFRGAHAERWLQTAGISPAKPVVVEGEEVPAKAAQAIEKRFRSGDWTSGWESEGWLRLAFASWGRTNRPSGPPVHHSAGASASQVDRAARWLEAQLTQSVSIAEMAKELGYHRTHLSKLFRKDMGMSPVRYLQKIRMERAKLLLREPLTVEQVAASVGYADPLYFSKAFKRWVGRTPTDFRKTIE
ncbi:AraC family transcriptional regulator [Cohnella pontilimi]|uniref:AraC family transcriptional regulator n=1 Tax=Cohnella pontilimi TaxID=2564100 RepID=A0A4U0FHI8_9BACL|nr:AraC family transcriptional regulator [Cohnella pontilimi]TJY44483.1 AraC family transcriptional regulator [Cohnella pontilimi]